MPYVRKHGNQVAIVHGERDRKTGKVQQRILFTLYSREEAREALGEGEEKGAFRFQSLLEHQYPMVSFNWKKVAGGIQENMSVLPESCSHGEDRLGGLFRKDLIAFTRQLLIADPQDLLPGAALIREHSHELNFLLELIQWRLKLCEQKESQWNKDNRFYWRFQLRGNEIPVEAEEFAQRYYNQGDLDQAKAVYKLLVDSFPNYADGHNYLGWLSLDRGGVDEAVQHFTKAIEVGRTLFPKRIGKKRYWRDHDTRPYIRGLVNLASALNQAARYDEALNLCVRIEKECNDRVSADSQRSCIFLNLGQWRDAADLALRLNQVFPDQSFIAAFACYQLDETMEALTWFLHAALRHPRAARMLAGKATRRPTSSEEANDHNTGIGLERSLHEYLNSRSLKARRFFSKILGVRLMVKLLEEMEETIRLRHADRTRKSGAFEKMNQMQSPEFARLKANELALLLQLRIVNSRNGVHQEK